MEKFRLSQQKVEYFEGGVGISLKNSKFIAVGTLSLVEENSKLFMMWQCNSDVFFAGMFWPKRYERAFIDENARMKYDKKKFTESKAEDPLVTFVINGILMDMMSDPISIQYFNSRPGSSMGRGGSATLEDVEHKEVEMCPCVVIKTKHPECPCPELIFYQNVDDLAKFKDKLNMYMWLFETSPDLFKVTTPESIFKKSEKPLSLLQNLLNFEVSNIPIIGRGLSLATGRDISDSFDFVRPEDVTKNVFYRGNDDFLIVNNDSEVTVVPASTGSHENDANNPFLQDAESLSWTLNLEGDTKVDKAAPLSEEKWRTLFDDDGRLVHFDEFFTCVYEQGVSKEIRLDVYKYLLGYYRRSMTNDEKRKVDSDRLSEYESMVRQWNSISPKQEERFKLYRENKCAIAKDVERADKHHEFFKGDDNENCVKLTVILRTYLMYNFDLGYAQGMSDLLIPLLYEFRDTFSTFCVFASLMETRVQYFERSQTYIAEAKKNLSLLFKYLWPWLYEYLEKRGCQDFNFCIGLLMMDFKRALSYQDTLRMWEVMWSQRFSTRYGVLACAVLVFTELCNVMNRDLREEEIFRMFISAPNGMNVEYIRRQTEMLVGKLKKISNKPSFIVGLLEEPHFP